MTVIVSNYKRIEIPAEQFALHTQNMFYIRG